MPYSFLSPLGFFFLLRSFAQSRWNKPSCNLRKCVISNDFKRFQKRHENFTIENRQLQTIENELESQQKCTHWIAKRILCPKCRHLHCLPRIHNIPFLCDLIYEGKKRHDKGMKEMPSKNCVYLYRLITQFVMFTIDWWRIMESPMWHVIRFMVLWSYRSLINFHFSNLYGRWVAILHHRHLTWTLRYPSLFISVRTYSQSFIILFFVLL